MLIIYSSGLDPRLLIDRNLAKARFRSQQK